MIDPAWAAQVRALYAEGLPRAEVAARMGIPEGTLMSRLRRLRARGGDAPERRVPWVFAKRKEADAVIRQMRQAGATYAAIGDALGVSEETARNRARKIGATRGKKTPPAPAAPTIAGGVQIPETFWTDGGRLSSSTQRRDAIRGPTLAWSDPTMWQIDAAPVGPASACQWPEGDPRAAGFRFCGARSAEGASYCAAHRRMAFVPVQTGVRRFEHVARFNAAHVGADSAGVAA